jgi:hypothetical protein
MHTEFNIQLILVFSEILLLTLLLLLSLFPFPLTFSLHLNIVIFFFIHLLFVIFESNNPLSKSIAPIFHYSSANLLVYVCVVNEFPDKLIIYENGFALDLVVNLYAAK